MEGVYGSVEKIHRRDVRIIQNNNEKQWKKVSFVKEVAEEVWEA